MAFYNENEEEETSPEQGFQIGGQAGSLSAGAGVAGGNAPQGTSSPKGDNPGNFVGLKTYLDANKNQANQFGEKVAGGISNKINNAQSGINNFSNQFENEAKGGLIQGFDTAKDEAGAITNKAATGELNALPNDQEKNRFGQIVNAQYSGPKTAQDSQNFNPVRQSVMEAQNLADLSKDESGSQDLVKQFSNKEKDYSQGANRLDSYLMNTQENKQRLLDARQNAANLQPGLAQAETNASNFAGKLQSDTEALKSEARKLLEGTSLSKKGNVQTELNNIQKQIEENNKKAAEYRALLADQSDKGSVSLTPEQYNELGLSGVNRLYGALNNAPNQYIGADQAFDPNAAISKEDQARLSALSQLSQTYGGDFTNPYASSQVAGTQAPVNPLANTSKAIQDEVARRQEIYNQANTSLDWVEPVLSWTPEQYRGFSDGAKTSEEYEKYLNSGKSGFNQAGVNTLLQRLNAWRDKYGYNDVVKTNNAGMTELPRPILR